MCDTINIYTSPWPKYSSLEQIAITIKRVKRQDVKCERSGYIGWIL